jgi:hypothetical protein
MSAAGTVAAGPAMRCPTYPPMGNPMMATTQRSSSDRPDPRKAGTPVNVDMV